MTDFTRLPDLASRALGGGVVAANDESFAERENLVRPEAPTAPTSRTSPAIGASTARSNLY